MGKFPKLTVIYFQKFLLVAFYQKMSSLILGTNDSLQDNIYVVLIKKKGTLDTWPQNLYIENYVCRWISFDLINEVSTKALLEKPDKETGIQKKVL